MTLKSGKLLRFLIVGVAVLFIVIGILNGEAKVVLRKAKAICYACIGLE